MSARTWTTHPDKVKLRLHHVSQWCSGYYYVPNQFDYYTYTEIYWVDATESFNDIFDSVRATFRVFMMNNFHGIMYSSMDAVGEELQPDKNFSSRLLFFLILAMLAMTCMIM